MEKRNGSIIIDPITGKPKVMPDPDWYETAEDDDGNINAQPVYVFPSRDRK